MGWQTINGERVYVHDQFGSWTPSPRNAALRSERMDEFVTALSEASLQEIRDYVMTHTNDAQEVRQLLAKLAVAVAYTLASR